MEGKGDKHKKLADYIFDDLGPDEVVEIEREISHNPKMSDSYRLNMQVKDYLRTKIQLEEMRADPQLEDAEKLADMGFHSELLDHETSTSRSHQIRSMRIGRKLLIPSLVAVVLIIVAVIIFPVGRNQDQLYNHYYVPIAASDFSQRGAHNTFPVLAEAINFYMDSDYQATINHLEQVTSGTVIQLDVHFFKGLSLMGLGRYQDAESELKKIVELNSRYQPDCMWYLSLCYVKTGDFTQASLLLDQLTSYDGLYRKDGQILLKKLRRLK